MKQNMKNAVSLLATALVCAGVLFVTHRITRERIASAGERVRINAARRVLPKSCKQIEAVKNFPSAYVGKNAQGKTIAYAVTGSDPNGYGGKINLIVGFTKGCSLITYHCLEHSESPDLGDLFLKPDFMNQFRGLNAEKDLALKTDGGDIVHITSATITSRAVCNAINDAKTTLQKILKSDGGPK